jgi:putative OPT family oligopeptide transporter
MSTAIEPPRVAPRASTHPAQASVEPPVPPLQLEAASPEQKDLYWYTHVYQGDRVPQLTVRAVAMGALLGMLMSVSNLYTTMKVGWQFGVAITACVLSFVLWNAARSLAAGRLGPMSILENNCMQSTASASGYSTGATISTAFGALLILDPQHHHVAWPIVGAFIFLTGALGVFLAVPMKRQLINQEQLPFPSGLAAATTLKSLYAGDADTLRKAYSLVTALVVGAVVGVLNTAENQFVALGRFFAWMRAKLFDIHLPDLIPASGFRLLDGKPMVSFGFEPSSLLIAAGMIVGMRVSLSMLGASAALYFIVAPWLHSIDLANAGAAGYIASIPTAGGGALFHPVKWSLWGGVAVMVFASFTSLALQWPTVVRSFRGFGRRLAGSTDGDIEAKMAAIEVPNRWFLLGTLPIGLALIALQVIAFQIQWWAGLIAVAASFGLVLVAGRSVGETDITPTGPMGKIMQLLFAVISPGNVTHNLVAAGAGASSATAGADLLGDLKSGYVLGANPRKQFLAQFVGVCFGTLAIVPAWYLMVPNVEALEKYPLPATQVWVAVARVLSTGVASIPMTARIAIVIGALIGIAVPILEKLFPKARRWMPSPIGLGLGWLVFFSNTLSFAIGAGIVWLWGAIHRKSQQTFSVPIASGLIAGESMLKALLAMLATVIGLTA